MTKTLTINKSGQHLIPITWFGEKKRLTYSVKLTQPNTELIIPVLLIGRGSQSLTLDIKVYHCSPNTKSQILIKGVVIDSAILDISGLINIIPKATSSDAWLSADLLLLSPKAKVRIVPNLEISENDVKVGHATTISQIDQNDIFYLMSRGLSKDASQELIVKGFFTDFLSNFPTQLQTKLTKRLSTII